MATLKLTKKKIAGSAPTGERAPRPPVRGHVAKPRQTLAQAQADRAARTSREPFHEPRQERPPRQDTDRASPFDRPPSGPAQGGPHGSAPRGDRPPRPGDDRTHGPRPASAGRDDERRGGPSAGEHPRQAEDRGRREEPRHTGPRTERHADPRSAPRSGPWSGRDTERPSERGGPRADTGRDQGPHRPDDRGRANDPRRHSGTERGARDARGPDTRGGPGGSRGGVEPRHGDPRAGDFDPRRGDPRRGDFDPRRADPGRGDFDPRRADPGRGDFDPRRADPGRGDFDPRRADPGRRDFDPRRAEPGRRDFDPRRAGPGPGNVDSRRHNARPGGDGPRGGEPGRGGVDPRESGPGRGGFDPRRGGPGHGNVDTRGADSARGGFDPRGGHGDPHRADPRHGGPAGRDDRGRSPSEWAPGRHDSARPHDPSLRQDPGRMAGRGDDRRGPFDARRGPPDARRDPFDARSAPHEARGASNAADRGSADPRRSPSDPRPPSFDPRRGQGAPRGDSPRDRDRRGAMAADDDDRDPPEHAPGSLRLSKRMSELGIASRREADEWIAKGWVRVDGRVVDELGTRVLPEQHVTVDAKARHQQAQRVTVLLNKPLGFVSGQAEDDHRPAMVLVTPENQWRDDSSGTRFLREHLHHLVPAGRLDLDSTGLLVLTQDGRVARELIGEDTEVEKEYHVEVEPATPAGPAPDAIERLRHGLELDGEALLPAEVDWLDERRLRVVLRQGKKRQIRRMCEAVGLKVLALTRVRIGAVELGGLPVGRWRYLRGGEGFSVAPKGDPGSVAPKGDLAMLESVAPLPATEQDGGPAGPHGAGEPE